MSTVTWINGSRLPYLWRSAWAGGAVPRAGDTAVISSVGDGAPITGDLLLPNSNDSAAGLARTLLVPTTIQVPENGYIFEYTVDTPPLSQVPAGFTISAETLDLLGAGSAVGIAFQRSVLAASSVVNISGVAYFTASYDNALDGTINVGLPLSIGGHLVPTPPADSHWVHSELDMRVNGYGSWSNSNAGQLTSYVPTTTNSGTITVGGGAQFRLKLDGNPYGAIGTLPGYEIAIAPSRSAFENLGRITIGPGGQMDVYSSDGTYGQPYAVLINDGLVQLEGARGLTTGAVIQANLYGSGTISLVGGTQTDPTKTYLLLDTPSVGQHYVVSDGTVVFQASGYSTTNAEFSGGSFTFANGSADLVIVPGISTYSLVGEFSVPLTGFRSGDHLEFGVMPISPDVASATFTPVWDQTKHVLQVKETSYDLFGTPTTGLAQALHCPGHISRRASSSGLPGMVR